MSPIRAVLFDFGGTLYDYGHANPAGDTGLLIELARSVGLDPAAEDMAGAYRAAMRRVYADYLTKPYYLHRDFFADVALGALAELGATPGGEHAERYHALREAVRGERGPAPLRDGVHDTLRALRAQGIYLGIVSNTDEAGFRETMTDTRLVEHFDSILTSEEAGSCKPDQRIFAEALARSGTEPHETLFVGDSLDQDIAGANRMGLRSVLIWSRADRKPPEREPRPHHVIASIPEVLDLVSPRDSAPPG